MAALAGLVLVAFIATCSSGVRGQRFSVTIIPANGEIQLGTSHIFLCKLSSGEGNFQWFTPKGAPIEEDHEEYQLQTIDESSNRLTIKALDAGQNGAFRCRAESENGDVAEQSINIRVIEKPTFSGNDQTFVESEEGSDAEIRCSVSGIPTPTIAWIRNGKDTTKLQDGRFSVTNGTLRISKVKVSDSGMYECRATIEARNEVEKKTFTLSVNFPASARSRNDSITVTGGTNSTATLICLVAGHPKPQITWSRDGKPVQAVEGKYTFNSDLSELRIQNVEKADEGDYNCTATNKLRQNVITMSLHVLDVQRSIQRMSVGAGGIVAIVMVIFLLVLVAVDISCYFTNRCGVLMCLAVNVLGKHPYGRKARILDERNIVEKPPTCAMVNVSGIEA